MNKTINKLFLLSSFAILSMTSLTGCSLPKGINPNPNGGDANSSIENHEDKGEVNNEIAPVTGYVKGSEERNKTKEEIYNSDGGLLIPFDEAYPEYMNQALYDENSILVKCLDSDIDEIASTLANDGVSGYSYTSKATNNASWYKLSLSNVKSNEVINAYRKMCDKALMFDLNYVIDKDGLYATPANTTPTTGEGTTTIDNCYIDGAENNTYFVNQGYFKNFGLKETYKYIKDNVLLNGGAGTIVAVIDTGVDLDHEDLERNIYKNNAEKPNNGIDDDGNGFVDDYHGWNFVDDNNNPDDDQGHGTHVAGIIGAVNNRIGTLGIAYNTQIMPIKAGDGSGSFTQENIAKAINYAYLNGADVINMSFGGATLSHVVQDALESAYTTSTLVAAAGNDGLPNENYPGRELRIRPSYPAALSYVIGVMSCNWAGVESPFSNFDGVAYSDMEYEVYAPGEGIYSTIPNNKYTALNGTSMAAPIVSGMAALLRAKFTDRVKYPSKFITAQLAGAPTIKSTCFDMASHKAHNMAPVINIFSSFMTTPKPNVNLLTYRVFDLKSYSSKNNNNGVLDAGETVYLAPTLINRWGMSKDTTITFDSKSSISQQESKYLTIENATLNFDGIGTYSRKHYLTLDSQNSNYIGCDLNNSVKITLSDKAPNLVNVPINFKVNFKNALDPLDLNTYTNDGTFHLTISSGEILPKVINKDTTLTKDHYYIIEEPMYINENVTVNVEPGTTIQIGGSSENGYQGMVKDSAKIVNNGTLNMIGSLEEPINIKQGNLKYPCRIESQSITNLKYCNIEHASIENATLIDHCSFTHDRATYKPIVNGEELYVYSYIYADTITNSKFIIESYTYWQGNVYVKGFENISNCLFEINPLLTSYDLSFNVSNNAKYCTFINESNETFNYDISNKQYKGEITKKFSRGDNDIRYFADSILEDKQAYISLVKNINKFEEVLPVNPFNASKYFEKNSSILMLFPILIINGAFTLLDGTEITPDYANINKPLYDQIITTDGCTTETEVAYIQIKRIRHASGPDTYSYGFGVFSDNLYIDFINNYKFLRRLWEIEGKHLECDNAYNNFLTADPGNISISVDESQVTKGGTSKNSFISNVSDPTAKDYIVKDGNDNPNKLILGEASNDDPELAKLWPYVLKCELTDKDGNIKNTFGKEIINVKLTFNRDMNMESNLRVRFGSSEPYGEYEINGKFIDARTWSGSFFINTTIENGEQYFNIEGGQAASDAFMTVQEPPKRFKFNIDTTIAMSQVINGQANDDGILLSWMQDEYSDDTIMGYNIYKSDKKNGNYQKINKNVISKDENTYLDTEVAPGETYWYTFTIVLSDFSETNAVGKAAVTAKDTMAPSLYHTPNYQGYTTEPFKITCKAKDNIGIDTVKLYYRSVGDVDYKCVEMNNVNDIYSYTLPINELNIAGLEYYIEASDGTNFITKGSADNPYQVIIKDGSIIANKGDVDGDGQITVIDAQMILNVITKDGTLTQEQFARADINDDGELTTKEALTILQYINGNITTIN